MNKKTFDRTGIQAWVSAQRASGAKIGFTCGAFDVLHVGHVEYLTEARKQCDVLIVAVNSNESIKTYKSSLRPINEEKHRMAVVAALQSVDAVILMEELRPAGLIQLLKPDVYIKGGDYAPENLKSKPLVDAYGGQVVCIPINSEMSTSAILERAALIQSHEKASQTPTNEERRIAFLDRDGTLIRDVPFLHDPSRVQLMPGVLEGLKQLQGAGFTLVMVTNQQGIGLGYFTEAEFIAVNQALLRKLGAAGVAISRIYYCAHSLADQCDCRKPGKLLFEKAMRYFAAKPASCYAIGDSITDCMAAEASGCASILISDKGASDASIRYVASSFEDAAQWILRMEENAAKALR